MTTKKKVTNGIIKIDGRHYMQCGDDLVPIRFVPVEGQEVEDE